METTDTQTLLLAYAQEGSENAFRELVRRYLSLVYSTALRRVNNDSHFAEDVTQVVFSDFARKAPSLPADIMIGGWLHQHTCFVASNLMRTERRRLFRETKAAAMNNSNDDAANEWEELAPVLDDAINELGDEDRRAVMLRFFEQRDFRSVGAALGVSDDSAQKRVSRALEKLRGLLVNHGVTLTVTALTTALTDQVLAATPADLANRVGASSLDRSQKAGAAARSSMPVKIAVFSVLLMAVFLLPIINRVVSKKSSTTTTGVSSANLLGSNERPSVDSNAISSGDSNTSNAEAKIAGPSDAFTNTNILRLTIIAADSGKPVPNVPIDLGIGSPARKLISDRLGFCKVPIPTNNQSLRLITRLDGFADTCLLWRPDRGEFVPGSYTLKLIRPVRISGKVIAPDGSPVTKASVGWNHEADPTVKISPESHEFSWIQVETDEEGRWQLNRIAPDMVRRLYGSAEHTNYTASSSMDVSWEEEMEAQLREGTHVFRLGAAFTFRGSVVDPAGQPVANATVAVGRLGSSPRREATSHLDGTFSVFGCNPGENGVSVEAEGFAPAAEKIEIVANMPPRRIQLQRGNLLRLKVMDHRKEPIAGATIYARVFGPDVPSEKRGGIGILTKRFKTDSSGIVTWTNAPSETICSASAKNYMDSGYVTLQANGEEHVIVLPSTLTISGTVRDQNGEPVPKFRIVCGWPEKTGGIHWSTIDRFWLDFSGGKFNYTFREGVAWNEPRYVFKFEGEGYASFVSRVVLRDEEKAELNVVLEKVSTPIVVTVLSADGTPAAGADIGWGSLPSGHADSMLKHLTLGPSGFERVYSEGKILKTDDKGRFRFAFDDITVSVVAVNADGYAEIAPSVLQDDPVIHLRPWGRIEGIYRKNGNPVAGEDLRLGDRMSGRIGIVLSHKFTAKTDSEGRFIFPRVPPTTVRLFRSVSTPIPSPGRQHERMLSPFNLRTIDVAAGEITRVDIDDSGYKISGRLRWPDGYSRATNTFVSGRFHTPHLFPPRELKGGRDEASWWQSAEVKARIQNDFFQSFPLANDIIDLPDGIPPGDYVLEVYAPNAVGPDGTNAFLRLEQNVRVPSDPPTGALDLGEVQLAAPAAK